MVAFVLQFSWMTAPALHEADVTGYTVVRVKEARL